MFLGLKSQVKGQGNKEKKTSSLLMAETRGMARAGVHWDREATVHTQGRGWLWWWYSCDGPAAVGVQVLAVTAATWGDSGGKATVQAGDSSISQPRRGSGSSQVAGHKGARFLSAHNS